MKIHLIKIVSVYFKFIALFCLVALSWNCRREGLKAAKPSLEVSTTKPTAYVGEAVPINLQLGPAGHRFHIVEEADKKGSLIDAEGKLTTDWYTQQSQRNRLYFKPMESGAYTLTFEATDDAKHSVTDTLDLSVKSDAFTVKVKPELERGEVQLGEGVQIGFHIEDKADKNLPKHFTFESDLKGRLFYAGRTCTQGNPIDIGTKTEFTARFQAQETGETALRFTFGNRYGQTQTVSLALKVVPPSFTVRATAEQNIAYLGKGVDIRLSINNQKGSNLPKNLQFQSSLPGKLFYGGKELSQNTAIDIGTQSEVKLRWKPEKTGTAELTFTFIDRYDQTQQASLKLEAESPPFAPTVPVVGEKSIFTNQTASLQLHIDNPEGVNLKKSLQFQSSLPGRLFYQNEELSQNTVIDIGTETDINLSWKPQKAGKAELTFTLSDAYERSQKTQAEIEVKDVPFDVSVTAQADQGSRLVKKGSVQFTVNPQGKASGITYHWRYSVTGTGAGVLEGYKKGLLYPVDPGQTIPYTYRINRESGPEASGTHRISITVADNYGQTITQDLAFEVVKFPTITDADFYYQLRHSFYYVRVGVRYLKAQHIKGIRGTYSIKKIKVKVYNCRGEDGKFTIDEERNYDPKGGVLILFVYGGGLKTRTDYMKDCGCETGEAKATFWLIDTQGNESRPLTKTLRRG